ncbi:MAG: ferritin-like domain-containing protein [Candidatus Latescibacteria bacterium]|nr:ferritin-like domain-containing protein [Candidatus Latescibacterota bacterium]
MDKKTLIDHLNGDLAAELGAIIQFTIYAAKATGPYRPELANFFLTEVSDEQLHAQYLANKIVALGGEPTTIPRLVIVSDSNQENLETMLSDEKKIVKRYVERRGEAEAFGDYGLMVQIEDMIRDESNHAEEVERMLRNCPE